MVDMVGYLYDDWDAMLCDVMQCRSSIQARSPEESSSKELRGRWYRVSDLDKGGER
jgi:hypothetical protein